VLIIEFMSGMSTMLTPREAARLIGISYPTIKHWILTGKLKTSRTPGGHHRIAEASLKPYLDQDNQKSAAESRERSLWGTSMSSSIPQRARLAGKQESSTRRK
jgi:excisionase family DNA binding protein